MKIKTKQFRLRWRYTSSNRVTVLRSRQYLINYLRENTTAADLNTAPNVASGIRLWRIAKTYHGEHRVAQRSKCIITGRNRGISGRYTVSRIQLKGLSNRGHLFGLRKSSW